MELTLDIIEEAERKLLAEQQLDCPVRHFFAPGVYVRQVEMPAWSGVIGHRHLTRHLNTVLQGRCLVMMDGETTEVVGPCTFMSEPGVRKVLLVLERTLWQTVHPLPWLTDRLASSDPEDLVKEVEPFIIEKSEAWAESHRLEHAVMEALK